MKNELLTLCINASNVSSKTDIAYNAQSLAEKLEKDGEFTTTDIVRLMANMAAVKEQAEAYLTELKKHASAAIETYQGDPCATANSIHLYGCTIKRAAPAAEYNFKGVDEWEALNEAKKVAETEFKIAKNNLANAEKNLIATGYYEPVKSNKDYTISLIIDK